MIILKVENGEGMYYTKEKGYACIDTIGKEEIIYLMELILDESNVNIEESNEDDKKINNLAQKIIYEKIYEKFKTIISSKEDIIEKSNEKYNEAFKNYMEEE